MSVTLKAYCVHCGGGMEFPAEIQGEKIICPHCNVLTALGEAKPAPTPMVPTVQQTVAVRRGRIKTKSEFAGMGCLIEAIALFLVLPGLILTFTIPLIGVPMLLIGLLLFLVGSGASTKRICSECGNPVASKSVRCCPACQARFK